MNILVVGDTGFVGGYLLPALKTSLPGCRLFGMSRKSEGLPIQEVRHFAGDITDSARTSEIVATAAPDAVINLTSFSSVFSSWTAPLECHRTNYIGTLNLCLAVLKHVPKARFLHISSLEVYGGSEDPSLTYDEASAVNPLSPYAASKAASELLLHQYGVSHGLRYTILRSANHSGPRRKPSYALSGFAKQLIEIKRKHREACLEVGNLGVHRDFLDVRDVAQAYVQVLLSENAERETFNVCSGNHYRLSDLLDIMISMAEVEPRIHVDPKRNRPVDALYVRGDGSKIGKVIGWRPRFTIEDTLGDLLAFWSERIDRDEIAKTQS